MKIGPYTIQRPWHKEQALDIDTAPMFKVPSRVTYKLKGLNTYYELYKNHDLCRGMIDDLSEFACGQGTYNTVEKLSPVLNKNRSKELCDEFGKQFNLDDMMPKIAKNTLIAGFCPVETKLSVSVDKCMLKVVHPQTIVKIETDPVTGDVLRAHQKVGDKTKVLEGTNLAWFTYGNLANDPRGISFIQSILTLLSTLDNASNTVSKIAERYISPVAVWKSRQSSADLKKAVVTNREEGEAIFLGSLTGDEMKEDTVKFYQVDPRVPFWDYMESLHTRLYAYSRASNVWFTKNANLASAEKMEDIVVRHVASIQRPLKRIIEKSWYEPLIKMNGLEEVPRVNFGKEPTGVGDITPSDIITKGLELGYISQPQYYEILRTIGVKITESLGETPKKQENPTEKPEYPEPVQKIKDGIDTRIAAETLGAEFLEHLTYVVESRRKLAEAESDLASTVASLKDAINNFAEKFNTLQEMKLANLKLEREVLTKINAELNK
jgi:hypothetical protein